MKINRENYEEYFVDYTEGNLDSSLYNDFLDFLNNNPDLKEELDHFQKYNLTLDPNTNISFSGKDSLRKDIESESNNRLIAALEGELSLEEKRKFNDNLENDLELKNEYIQFRKTKLIPDLSIIFRDKNSLKRTVIFGLRRRSVFSILSAAASVILLFSIYLTANNFLNPKEKYYSERNEQTLSSENENNQDSQQFIAEASDPTKDEKTKTLSKREKVKKEIDVNKKKIIDKLSNQGKDDMLDSPNSSVPVKRDSTNKRLKKIIPNDGKLQLKEKKQRSKLILKPVEIQSQGLLAYLPTQAQSSGDDYLTVKELMGKTFKKKVLKNDSEDSYNLSAWDFADAGLKGLNKLTGSNMGITKRYDNNGEFVAYSFTANKFSIERGVKKEQ